MSSWLLIALLTLSIVGCGRDNFFVSSNVCDTARTVHERFNCSTFRHKPWFYGLDEMSGFFAASNTATPRSEFLLETLVDAKANDRYVAVGGDPEELLLATLSETLSLWARRQPDLSDLRVQVHAERSAKDRALQSFQQIGVEVEFYELPARP